MVIALSLLLALVSACDTDAFECQCAPCGPALVVVGVDTTGAVQAGAWTVAATLDGEPVDTSNCDPAVRGDSNECGFGFGVGVYQLLVRSDNGEKAVAARFSSQVGQNCCACILSERVQVVIP